SLSDLSVPRVAAHSAKALSYFIYKCPKIITEIHFEGLMQSLEEMIRNKYTRLVPDPHGLVLGELLGLIKYVASTSPEGVPKF
ncbi:hypothetical protein PENTCL1PPCAC_6142, partial [Pristionchus entomophagus]